MPEDALTLGCKAVEEMESSEAGDAALDGRGVEGENELQRRGIRFEDQLNLLVRPVVRCAAGDDVESGRRRGAGVGGMAGPVIERQRDGIGETDTVQVLDAANGGDGLADGREYHGNRHIDDLLSLCCRLGASEVLHEVLGMHRDYVTARRVGDVAKWLEDIVPDHTRR